MITTPRRAAAYEKPRLDRLGTFRDLTRSGRRGAGDACFVLDPAGSVDDGDALDERCYE
ncbi:MAG TPA: lasso RiPP family leader peptide-containing protein [Gemmatimonadaceae bacterium]|jgi:hypothetical protein|nr:lasso RiPP family leader peptide-containing protein [Gemmatimonadaceae bacterium]